MISVDTAKSEMKKRGHSYRSAAKVMGKHHMQLYKVLNGKEKSRPILEGIYKLPIRKPKAYLIKRGDYPELKVAEVAK